MILSVQIPQIITIELERVFVRGERIFSTLYFLQLQITDEFSTKSNKNGLTLVRSFIKQVYTFRPTPNIVQPRIVLVWRCKLVLWKIFTEIKPLLLDFVEVFYNFWHWILSYSTISTKRALRDLCRRLRYWVIILFKTVTCLTRSLQVGQRGPGTNQ